MLLPPQGRLAAWWQSWARTLWPCLGTTSRRCWLAVIPVLLTAADHICRAVVTKEQFLSRFHRRVRDLKSKIDCSKDATGFRSLFPGRPGGLGGAPQ